MLDGNHLMEIDLNGLDVGIYFIRVNFRDQAETLRIIKNK